MDPETAIGADAQCNGSLPATRAECRAVIDRLAGEIDAIKAQIAAADLERQARHGRMDPRWYHRARTAIRFKRQEIAEVTAHMATLPSQRCRNAAFKDCLIEVLRADHDDAEWKSAMDTAHRLLVERDGA